MRDSADTMAGTVPLRELGEHMRAGRWLDIRYDDELLERVRIMEIIVRVEGEDVVLRQEWLDEERADDDYFHRQRIVIDSEGVWKVRPTVVHIADVRPHGAPPPPPQAQDEELQQRIAVVALESARFLWRVKAEELRNTHDRTHIDKRYACIIVLYEMSDLGDGAITQLLGYASAQPLVSARYDVAGPRLKPNRREMTLKLASLVDEQFKPLLPRSSRSFPDNYQPVIMR